MAEVSLFGESFDVTDAEIPRFLLAELGYSLADSKAAEQDAALLRVLKVCIKDEDWGRFRSAAVKAGADSNALVDVIGEVITARNGVEAVTGRPTERPSNSSDGQEPTEASSTAASSSPVIRLEKQGRPDLALMVTRAQEARAAG